MALLIFGKLTACHLLLVLLLHRPPVLIAKNFEAAFQGECREDSPCQHLCFDLHDGTFECACKDGFTLSVNGYSCIENSKLRERDWGNASLWMENMTSSEDFFNSEDIDSMPSLHTLNDGSPESRAYHQKDGVEINFETLDKEFKRRTHHRPVSYEHLHENSASRSLNSFNVHPQEHVIPKTVSHGDVFQPLNTIAVSTPSVHQVFHTCSELQCEHGGNCVLDGTSKQTVRCKCPLGFGGTFCEQVVEAKYPRFHEDSYIALPILRDAHKSMQVTLEFRPEANDGLILYSGEKLDLRGDFISISLNKGFIEFRFDCGMGEGVLISDQPIVLRSWNTLTIYRDRWDAWMQLNSGTQVQGRSKGLFSRITFRLNLYIGGSPNISLVADRTQVQSSFKGCLRHLAINRHVYDFRPSPRGDALEGNDIDECSADVCSKVTCLNGGQCVAASPDYGVCLCPLGFIGDKCESAMELIVPLFNGSSYLQYPGLSNTVLSFIELQIVFKPYRPNGVLFYNGYKMDGTGDFITLNLVNGYLEFRFDLGTGAAVIRSVEPLAVGVWHTVFISRTGRDGILEVDDQPKVEGTSPGAFTQLSLPLNMYIGGVHDARDVARKASITESFTGCIQKVVINGKPLKLVDDALAGINVANCLHSCVEEPCKNGGHCEPKMAYYSCHCHLGYAGNNCEKEVTEMIAEPMFTGASYLHYLDENVVKRIRGNKLDIKLKFRSFGPSGLLLWSGKKEMSASSDYLSLGLKEGYLHFQYNLGSGEIIIVYNTTRVDDGKWHTVKVTRVEQEGSLIVDNGIVAKGTSPGILNQLNVNNGLYLGGMESIASLSMNKYHSGLVGCLANVTLSTNYHIRLITHATTGINIQACL
ncbi:pikachurin-like [Argiope bruennichi]|uniref:Pikachurin like protein n=1 Tax=Argiope bruennichi TaxID=94029 RepID=A0A8T0FIN7_ARGBR|nr:pikachurin-like [Argiope bruennichi]KAF8791124.1 Pikachurin like protein [Argiope bruennichi]